MANPWLDHVAKVRKTLPPSTSFMDVLKKAKLSYTKKSSSSASPPKKKKRKRKAKK